MSVSTTAERIKPAAAEFSITRAWQSDRRGPVRWILSHALRHKLLILGVFIGALGNGLGAGVVALYIGQAFELMTRSPDYSALGWIALHLIGSQLIRGVLMLGRNFCSEIIGQRVERDTRDELYLSLIGKSMSFHDSQATGDLMARATNDVREINMLFNPGMNLVIGSANFMIAPFILVPSISPQLLLVPTLYALIYIFLLRGYLARLRPATEAVRQEFGRLNATLAEAIDGIETVKGAAQEAKEINRFEAALARWRNAFVGQGDVEAKFFPLLLLGLLYAAGLLHSLILYQQGQLEVGQVIAFNAMLILFQFPTFAAQFAYSQVSSGISSARRVLELLNAQTELDQNVGGYEGPLDGSIRFENVTFSYNGGSPALSDVSFKVEPGQTVAIVGQTGAGKSTIAKLINRTYDVTGGQLIIGGVNVRDWNLEALRQQISIIEQDIYLFSRTIAENIAFGCPQASREEIEAAATAAQAHDFIMNFQDGYETVVGERGVTLSGGQRQRLALARAFLTNPRILILDDSTSAIDSATEDKIQRAIEKAAQGRTTLLITHRLSQIRWADLIVVLRKGRVAMVGDHETLLRESEAYRNIFARYE
ncbi:MAG: ABC transporter ATP-binding protein/permease [Anaerolineae bacterium]|nr:ABC transporter ATP-binding protein/permease [Anaerolineae bacterium]